jgi:hypothetical protein
VEGFAEEYFQSVIILKLNLIPREGLDIEVSCIPYSGATRYAHFCRERV